MKMQVHRRSGVAAAAALTGISVCFLMLLACNKPAATANKTAAVKEAKAPPADTAADAKGEVKADTKIDGATVEGAEAKPEGTAAEDAGEGVTLKAEEVEKMGLKVEPAVAATHVPETGGFGVVAGHDVLAQALSEWVSAAAMARQSESAFARAKKLAGTAGAMPAEASETAQRQAEVDQAALMLTRRKLTSTFGQTPPWKDDPNSPVLRSLASGDAKLVRVTFPLGALGDEAPKTLRLARLGHGTASKSWTATSVWSAPADATVPGRSFFVLLKGSDVGEGERLLVWTPSGESESGAKVPAAAAVISGGKYWAYVERKPNVFARTELETSNPVDDGYFVKEGIAPNDKIVVNGAGLLLARETNPSSAAE